MVDQLVTEGPAAGDELGRAWLLLARGVSARRWRGTEPFGQGTELDPVPIGEGIADVERAMAGGEAAGDLDLAASAASALNVLYGVAGRYREVRDLTGARSSTSTRSGRGWTRRTSSARPPPTPS